MAAVFLPLKRGALANDLSPVIPGPPQAEPGIHGRARAKMDPGFATSSRPGVTKLLCVVTDLVRSRGTSARPRANGRERSAA